MEFSGRFVGLEEADFDVFEVPGLELRMQALKAHLRPKLEQLGEDFSHFLSDLLGMPMYPHVARHARRTVNPPQDSWVAFSFDKRGYKKHAHFQIGAWQTHAFATFGLIYESPLRQAYARQLQAYADEVVRLVPKDYVWIPNHMDKGAIPAAAVQPENLFELTSKMASGRQGELLVGIQIPRAEAVVLGPQAFEEKVAECFRTLAPLYEMATKEGVPS